VEAVRFLEHTLHAALSPGAVADRLNHWREQHPHFRWPG
jgi:hypothetical protein